MNTDSHGYENDFEISFFLTNLCLSEFICGFINLFYFVLLENIIQSQT